MSFLFPEARAQQLAAVRLATGGFVLWQLVDGFQSYAAIARTPVSQWHAVGPLILFSGPLDPALFDVWNVLNLLLALCFFVGIAHRVLAPLFAVSALFFFAYRTAWGGVLHADNLFCLHLICLALGPAASVGSLDALWARLRPQWGTLLRWGPLPAVDWRFGWNLRLICTVTTLTYFLAGVAKVVSQPGLGWLSGGVLLDQIGNDAIYKEMVSSKGASAWVPWAYQHPDLLLFAAIGTLILEVGAPLALLNRRLGWVWCVGIWAMHQGIAQVMGIVFPYPYSAVAFVSFFPVDVWVARLYQASLALSRGQRRA